MLGGGFFGKAFDFDRDGELNPFERAVDFAAFMQMVEEDEGTRLEREWESDRDEELLF